MDKWVERKVTAVFRIIDPIDLAAGFIAGNIIGYRMGYELTVGENFRLAPWGNHQRAARDARVKPKRFE